jgi:hypothetical protein
MTSQTARHHSVVPLAALQPPSPPNRCRPSPCDRLSRPRSTTAAPPLPDPIGRRWTQPNRTHAGSAAAGSIEKVPVFTAVRSMKEEPSCAPAASPRLTRSTSPWPPGRHPQDHPGVPRRSGLRPGKQVRTAPGPYPPGLSRQAFKGRRNWFLSVLLSITLAGPAPSGSADTSRLCQGCSHPHRHLPEQAAPSFTALLRQGQRRRSLTSYSNSSASRRTRIEA